MVYKKDIIIGTYAACTLILLSAGAAILNLNAMAEPYTPQIERLWWEKG